MFRSHHSRRMIIGLAAAAGIAGLNVLATTSAASAGIGPANPPATVNTIGPPPVVCGVAVHRAQHAVGHGRRDSHDGSGLHDARLLECFDRV